MKKISKLIFMIVLITAVFMNCGKDNPLSPETETLPPPPGDPGTGTERVLNVAITYNGSRTVNASSPVVCKLSATTTDLTGSRELTSASGTATFSAIPFSSGYVRAFVDLDGDGEISLSEPFEYYENSDMVNTLPAVVDLPSGTKNLSVIFNDAYDLKSAWQLGGSLSFDRDGQAQTLAGNAEYLSDFSVTYIYATDEKIDTEIAIITPGSSAGTWDQNDVTIIYFYNDDLYWADWTTGSCTVTISAYGAVDEMITGTFSGTMVSDDGTKTIAVQNGQFNVNRITSAVVASGKSGPMPSVKIDRNIIKQLKKKIL